MKIAKDTTDEQLLAPVHAARLSLIDAVTRGETAERLAAYVNDVAEAEGRAYVRGIVRDSLIDQATGQQVRDRLLRLLSNGPDDNWSGRKNDARRAHYEGLCKETHDLITGGLRDYGW